MYAIVNKPLITDYAIPTGLSQVLNCSSRYQFCLFFRTENSEHYDDLAEDSIGSLQEIKAVSRNKLQLGEDLFHKVAEIETELCAQVTGKCNFFILMLLVRTLYTTYFPARSYYSRVATAQGKHNLAPFSRRGKHRDFALF